LNTETKFGKVKSRIGVAEILKENEYINLGFTTNSYSSKYYNYNRGYDFYHDIFSEKKKEQKTKNTPKKSGKLMTLLKKNWLYEFFHRHLQNLRIRLIKNLKYKELFSDFPPYERISTINREIISKLRTVNSKFFANRRFWAQKRVYLKELSDEWTSFGGFTRLV